MQRILDYNYKENIFLVDNEFNCMLEIAYKITKHRVFWLCGKCKIHSQCCTLWSRFSSIYRNYTYIVRDGDIDLC